VPEPSSEAESRGSACAASTPTLVGIYPRGLSFLALAELARAEATVVEHLEAFCVVLFRPPPPAPGAVVQVLELSTFELIFESVGGAVPLPPEPSLAEIGAAAESQIREHARLWREHLCPFRKWRLSVHRDHLVQRYKSPVVVPVLGDGLAAVGAISLAEGCQAGPEVDLTGFEVEVVAYLSDGIDKLLAANDTKARASLGGGSELLLLGVRSASLLCRPVALEVQKGALRSRADDTVALCVAQRAADLLVAPGLGGSSGAAGARCVVLDPMCGVGTYLLALRWVLAQRRVDGQRGAELIGVDLDSEALSHVRTNLGPEGGSHPFTIIHGSSVALPLRSDSVDLIVADPPWGQRHSSHTYVKQHFPRWAREWARVLRPGGAAVVVTICKKVFEDRVLPPLQKAGLLELEEAVVFDNKGWTVCRMYVVRKPASASAAQRST